MDNEMILQPRFSLDSPYLADYFGVWMIHDQSLLSFVERLNGTNLHVHLQSAEVKQQVSSRDSRLYPVSNDGIARFDIRGPTMKSVPSMADGTSTVRVRQQLRAARRDAEVLGGLMVLDTPGGTSKGNEDLANEVAAFAAEKPLFAFIEDLTASAGVAVASQATRRYANNATAIYGAMGTYAVLQDLSGMADKLGVKVHVIRAGEFKGLGEPGTPVTEAQVSEIQRIVNRINASYLSTIAKGLNRSADSILPLADGRAILAADAVTHGLLDGIQTYEQTYAQLVETVSARRAKPTTSTRRNTAMADTPATLAELKATFPNSTAEWRESQLEAGATVATAAVAYATYVEAKAAAEREQHAKDLADAKNAATKPPLASSLGHRPLTQASVAGDDLQESGEPIGDFDAAVRARLPKHGTPTLEQRQAAIAYVARTRPELHLAYLSATNAGSPRVARMLKEKYEAPAK